MMILLPQTTDNLTYFAQSLGIRGIERRLYREHSGSVVECLTRDPEAVGSNLTGVTALCP